MVKGTARRSSTALFRRRLTLSAELKCTRLRDGAPTRVGAWAGGGGVAGSVHSGAYRRKIDAVAGACMGGRRSTEKPRTGGAPARATARRRRMGAVAAGFPSDAYATGQTLYALHEAAGGWRWTTLHGKRAGRFLLETQHEDGSWRVRSRAVKFQPYFESGFPYAHDQWISAAGTAWAGTALALALER